MSAETQVNLTFPLSVDSTILSSFTSCPRKFYYEFLLKRVPEGKSIDLHAGGCFALGLEIARNAFYVENLTQDEAIARAWVHMVKEWGEYTEPEDHPKSFLNMFGALCHYFDTYPMENDHFQPITIAGNRKAIEFTFAIPTAVRHPDTGEPILYSGRCDMVVEDREGEGGVIFALDDKTTKAMNANWADQWAMRGQFYGYVYACRAQGINAIGAVVRGISILKGSYKTAEATILFSDEQIEKWWLMINTKILRMVQAYSKYKELLACFEEEHLTQQPELTHIVAAAPWEMSYGDGCMAYFRPCSFTPLCTSSEPWEIYSDWDNRVWDPLAKDPTGKSEDRFLAAGPLELPDELHALLWR